MMKVIVFGQPVLLLVFVIQASMKCQATFCSDLYERLKNELRDHWTRCSSDNTISCCEAEEASLNERVKNHEILCGLRIRPCKKKNDIIFVLDRSSSIKPRDYDKLRVFLQKIAKRYKMVEWNDKREIIGQGAIVTFSEKGEKRVTLNESQIPGRFVNVTKAMPGPLPGGRTKTHLGLYVADKKVAIEEAGYRVNDSDVRKIIMVITDGEQTKGGRGYIYVGDAMKPFFNRDMDVFAIGVELKEQSAINEIRDMVNVPENAILAANYTELSTTKLVENALQRFCPDVE